MLKARYKGSIIKDTVIMLLDNKYKVMGIFVLLVLGIFFFLNAGKMSVDNEPPQQADVIMVPIGGFPDRIHYAVDLYKQGYADKIIMVESWEPVSDRLNARGVKITTLAQQTAMLAIQMGVPTSAVTILPGAALSFKEEGTEQEALYFLKYLQEHPENKKVILTTSLFHSARADAIFE